MAFPRKLKQLCTPAFLYFSLAMLGVLVSVVQNLGNRKKYCLGRLTARVPSTFLVFVVKIIYILFWTWVLNLICKDGHKGIAWFLVIAPFILLFLLIGSMMNDSKYEGFGYMIGAKVYTEGGGGPPKPADAPSKVADAPPKPSPPPKPVAESGAKVTVGAVVDAGSSQKS